MYTLTINVTKEILEKTKLCRVHVNSVGKNCAIAHAVRKIFPKAYVESEEIYPFGGNNLMAMRMPTKARNFVEKFDNNNAKQRVKMKPLSFDIKIPDEVIDKLSIDELKHQLINHPTLELQEK